MVYRKTTDMMYPGPATTWVLVDERSDSINDGIAVVGMQGFSPQAGVSWGIVDYPASYHGLSGGYAFADGHSELRRWQDDQDDACGAAFGWQALFQPEQPGCLLDDVSHLALEKLNRRRPTCPRRKL